MNEYIVNFELLKKVRKNNRKCLCSVSLCPCDDFIDKGKCKCGVFR